MPLIHIRLWTSKVSQTVKVLADKLAAQVQSLKLMVEGKSASQLSSDYHNCTVMCAHPRSHIQTQINKYKQSFKNIKKYVCECLYILLIAFIISPSQRLQ